MKLGMRVAKIEINSETGLRYELASIDEKYRVLFVMHVNKHYQPQWNIGEIVELDVPEVSLQEGITMRKLREEARKS